MNGMKALYCATLAGLLWLAPPALARDWGPGFRAHAQAKAEPVKKGPQQPRGEREKRGEQDKRHHGRLTEEQRRDLHRDLDRANREIYRR